MSKRVNNKKGKRGRSPKFNKQVFHALGKGADKYSPYRQIAPKYGR